MKSEILKLAKACGADLVGVAPASRFPSGHKIFRIYPGVKSVIGFAFRCLRGSYRGTEEGTTYYQYTTMSVENLEETVMPVALVRLANLIESKGFTACSWVGWVGGTMLGAWDRTSGLMSTALQRSMGLALYAMFLAIILPEARRSRPAFFCVAVAALAGVGLRLLPTGLDVGWTTLIAGVVSAVVAAVLFPKRPEERDA